MIARAYSRKRSKRRGTSDRKAGKPFNVTSKQHIDKVINPNSDARIEAKLRFVSTSDLRRGQQVGFMERIFNETKEVKEDKEVFYKIAMKKSGLSGFMYTCEEV